MEYVYVDVMSREIIVSMLKLCPGSMSMLTLCQRFVKGGGPCRHWLPLFCVKHIFYILSIKCESMSTVMSMEYVHVYVMSREILSMLTLFQGSRSYMDVMSRVCHGRRSCFVKNKSCLGCLRTPEKKFKMFPS